MIPPSLRELQLSQGAIFPNSSPDGTANHFSDLEKEYLAAREKAALFDISPRTKIEVSGPDTPVFLNNLSTNQVADLPLGAGCEAFFTTAKAKIIAQTRIYHIQRSDGQHCYWLDSSAGQNLILLQHLDKHLISEQVEFACRTENYCQFHLAGPRAMEVLEKCLGEISPRLEIHQHMMRPIGNGGLCHIRFEPVFSLPGYDLVCLNSRATEVWKSLTTHGAAPAGSETLEVLRVEAGYPVQGKEMVETTFLPELDRTSQAISQTKGCFLGQEPIVMARDRGQVNRKLRGLILGQELAPKGTPIFKDGNEIGWITSSVHSPSLKSAIALGYLRRGNQEPGTKVECRLGDKTQEATVQDLPFSVS
ncbi:MAG: aminomethyl transferase family protein [Gemmataceae bacterium]|nr:aminomethyl transferase family protein [Gemmataceae bacterium]